MYRKKKKKGRSWVLHCLLNGLIKVIFYQFSKPIVQTNCKPLAKNRNLDIITNNYDQMHSQCSWLVSGFDLTILWSGLRLEFRVGPSFFHWISLICWMGLPYCKLVFAQTVNPKVQIASYKTQVLAQAQSVHTSCIRVKRCSTE